MSNVAKNVFGNPTIRANPKFNATETADQLSKAIAAGGSDKAHTIIQALCTCNNDQRQLAAAQFKTMFGKELVGELRKALSSDFESLMLALMERPDRYDAKEMHRAMAGLGTNEAILIEILVTHSNRQIRMISAAYRELFAKELEKDIIGDTSGPFRNLLVSLCNVSRDESWATDHLKANQDARQLKRDGEDRRGVNPDTFNKILATQNFAQLKAIFGEYEKIAGHPIEKAVEGEFGGDNRAGFLAVVKCVRDRDAFYAEALYNSMKGLGTRDADLIRLVVSRAEVDLADIRAVYASKYKVALETAIKDDTSGAYKDAWIALVRGNI